MIAVYPVPQLRHSSRRNGAMKKNICKTLSGPILAFGLATPFLVNCDGLPGIPGLDCDGLKTGDFSALKLEGSAAGSVKSFLGATVELDKFVTEVETNLIASCQEFGKALGMDEAELAAQPDKGEGAKKVCDLVNAKIDGILKASGNVELELAFDEPRCEADIEAMEACFAECDPAFTPGSAEVECEGGEISGECSGKCEGSCALEAGAECSGQCGGDCEGKCDGKDSTGRCEGKCDGKCSGECKVEAKGECKGSCRGKCDVKMKAPSCSGDVKPPKLDVSCQTNCSVKMASAVKCHPPAVSVKVKGDAKLDGDLKVLVDGIKVALPKILNIQIGLAKKFPAKIEGMIGAGKELAGNASSLGNDPKIAICLAGAGDMLGSASGSFKANVSVSASVSASASGKGEAKTGG